MQKLTFEEGYKEFEINNDPNRVLRFNPTDIALVDRIKKELTSIGDYAEKYGTKNSLEIADDLDKEMRKHVDEMFYEGSAKIIFADQNVLTTINGVTIFERFFRALLDIMKPYIEKESRKTADKFSKYKKDHDRITAEVTDNK